MLLMTYCKQKIKSRIHPLVWERLGQAKQEYFWTKQKIHCESSLIPFFREHLSEENGYYVDVGSYDGRSASNTYHLEKSQNWTGILIEPILHQYFRSKQIRNSKNYFVNAACINPEFGGESVEMLYSASMSALKTKGNESKADKWAEIGGQFLSRGEEVSRTWSPARTLESILIEAGAPKRVNLLSIDVEGNELGVLQGVNLGEWIFETIVIETEEDSPAFQLLCNFGYTHLVTIGNNVVFIY
jgi:FkbM family methyltransferase